MAWSNDYIGIPFKLNGRGMSSLDCWGLVREVYSRELGIALPAYSTEYQSAIDSEGFGVVFSEEQNEWIEVDRGDASEFDAVWCRIAGIECHVGVFLGRGQMLHAMQGADSCIVNIESVAWRRRVVQWYRHPSQ